MISDEFVFYFKYEDEYKVSQTKYPLRIFRKDQMVFSETVFEF